MGITLAYMSRAALAMAIVVMVTITDSDKDNMETSIPYVSYCAKTEVPMPNLPANDSKLPNLVYSTVGLFLFNSIKTSYWKDLLIFVM